MNAVAMLEPTPQIKNLIRKKQEAERKLPLFQATFEQAESRHATAEKKRLENTDPDRASDLLVAVQVAKASRDAAAEPLRVTEAQIVSLAEQIEAARTLFHETEFNRQLEAYKLAKAESRKVRLAAERADIELDRKFLAELSLHKPGYPAFVDHGDPQIHIGSGDDVVARRVIADCRIGENKTFFELLKV